MDNMIVALSGLIISNLITPLLAWYLIKRKHNAEAGNSELEMIQKALGIWRETSEKLASQIVLLENKITYLEESNRKLEESNRKFTELIENHLWPQPPVK